MRMVIKALQPYQVRVQAELSMIQTQCLIHFYQPIIGTEAVGLYMTLLHQPRDKGQWSQRLLHAQLIQMLNLGIIDCDKARLKLEAVGLLKTYRQLNSSSEWANQTLLYDLKLPLDIQQFIQHPLLNTSLFNQIGDQSYYQLLRNWSVEELNSEEYSEITSSFDQVFNCVNLSNSEVEVEALKQVDYMYQVNHPEELMEQTNFNYGQFLKFLMSEGVEHYQFTQELKEIVLAVHQVYQLNESQMIQTVKLAINPTTNRIELDQIKVVADKQKKYSHRQEPLISAKKESAEHKQTYMDQIGNQYPELSSRDLELAFICKQFSCSDFLSDIKGAKGGFATDNEQYYVKDLLSNKTKLKPEVINFLIYYLLVMENRDNIFKNELERLANQWQQAKIDSVPQAMVFQKQASKIKTIKDKQQHNAKKPAWGQTKVKHQEALPSWYNKKSSSSETHPKESSEPAKNALTQEELLAELNKLTGKG